MTYVGNLVFYAQSTSAVILERLKSDTVLKNGMIYLTQWIFWKTPWKVRYKHTVRVQRVVQKEEEKEQ